MSYRQARKFVQDEAIPTEIASKFVPALYLLDIQWAVPEGKPSHELLTTNC